MTVLELEFDISLMLQASLPNGNTAAVMTRILAGGRMNCGVPEGVLMLATMFVLDYNSLW